MFFLQYPNSTGLFRLAFFECLQWYKTCCFFRSLQMQVSGNWGKTFCSCEFHEPHKQENFPDSWSLVHKGMVLLRNRAQQLRLASAWFTTTWSFSFFNVMSDQAEWFLFVFGWTAGGNTPPTPSHCIILARTLSIADSFSVCHWWLLLDFLIHEPDCVACSYFHHPMVSKVVWGPCSRQN